MKEAILYSKGEGNSVRCNLCRRGCTIPDGERGFCHVRENRGGKLYSLVYGKAVAAEVDPIEKKPFYHFMPGAECFSFATVGCDFNCLYCQNSEISQVKGGRIIGEDWSPERIVEYCKEHNLPGIAYTYTEPTIFMEYALDTAKLAHKEGLFNVFVTNGYMSEEAINEMEGLIDAARIDLKGFNERIYKEVCGGVELEGILSSIKSLHKKMHIEIINLVVPGYNDSEEDLRALSKWCAELDSNVPLHFIGFYPAYKMMGTPRTSLQTLLNACTIAMEEGVKFTYSGNLLDEKSESTYCPNCREQIVRRRGFLVLDNRIKGYNKCPECGEELYFVGDIKEYWKQHKPRK